MARTELVLYYGYYNNPATECYPQWAIKTESSKEYSHQELIAVQHVCDNISMMSLVMFSDG